MSRSCRTTDGNEALVTLVSFLFGRSYGDQREPWVEDSIYRLIESSVDPDTGQLPVEEVNLPDEVQTHNKGQMSWAAGALDGVMGTQVGDDHEAIAKRAGRLLERISQTGDS